MPVFLLRHGESTHNVSIKQYMDTHPESHVLEWWEVENAFDPKIRDADLTEKGVTQAQEVRRQVTELGPTLLMMSPLTRSLRTGMEACADILNIRGVRSEADKREENCDNSDGNNDPTVAMSKILLSLSVKITPLLREQTFATCDLGSTVDALQEKFPHWSAELQDIPAEWWCHSPSVEDPNSRLSCRESWQTLQDRTEALCKMITEAQQEHDCIVIVGHAVLFYALTGEWMSNCQLMELDMNKLRVRCTCETPACCCE